MNALAWTAFAVIALVAVIVAICFDRARSIPNQAPPPPNRQLVPPQDWWWGLSLPPAVPPALRDRDGRLVGAQRPPWTRPTTSTTTPAAGPARRPAAREV